MTAEHPRPGSSEDVSALLGLQSAAATAMVGFFIVTFAVVGIMTAPSDAVVPGLLAWLLVSVAAVVLVRAPGDPLPWPGTAFIGVSGPAATALTVPFLSVDALSPLNLWTLSATTALAAYLCVRGRAGSGWISLWAAIGVVMVWTQAVGAGAGYGFTLTLINLAPLVMATFFTLSIRPAARNIFVLRRAATKAVAAQAAHGAALEERNRQLVRLDQQARPLLERLSEAAPLSRDEQQQCGLVEARLRDSLRAPVLDRPDLADAVWRARSAGIEVVLLDDHGLDAATDDVRHRVLTGIVAVLDRADAGTITVRVLPPGRPIVATVLCADDADTVRHEYGRAGELTPAR